MRQMKVHAVNQSSMNASRGFGGRKNNNFVSSMKRNTGCYHSKVINKAETSAPQCLSAVWISGNYDSLPEVPMCYPIERTSIVVGSYDPSEIARRILRCLQMLSITAKCNASEVRSWQVSLLALSLKFQFVTHLCLVCILYYRHLCLPRLLITQSFSFECIRTTLLATRASWWSSRE